MKPVIAAASTTSGKGTAKTKRAMKAPAALKDEHGSLERAFAALTRGEERV